MVVWGVAICSWALGWLLAQSGAIGLRPSYAGVLLFLVFALMIRQRWLRLSGVAEGSPERALWVSFISRSVIGGFLLHELQDIGPNFVMHTPRIHAFGIATWTLIGGALLAAWVARDPDPRRDERDTAIAHLGQNVGYWSIFALLVVLILALGFGFSPWVRAATHAALAHVLILIVLLADLADLASRLWRYRQDHRLAQDES